MVDNFSEVHMRQKYATVLKTFTERAEFYISPQISFLKSEEIY